MNRLRFARLLMLVFVPAALIATAGAWLLARGDINAREATRNAAEKRNLAHAAEVASRVVDAITRDLLFLAGHSALLAAVDDPSPAAIARLASDLVTFSNSRQVYDKLRWIDERGIEVVRVDLVAGRAAVIPPQSLQDKSRRYFFTDTMALTRGELFVSPFDLNVERDQIELPHKPTIRVGTPVFGNKGANGRARGIVLLNYLGGDLLHLYERELSGSAGHIMLLNREGHWIRSPQPADEWGFMFNRSETFATRHPGAWARVASEARGQFEDAEGLWTFETIWPLISGQRSSSGSAELLAQSAGPLSASEYFWKPVTLIPAAALRASRAAVWKRFAAPYAATLVLALFASIMLAQAWERRRFAERQLRQSNSELERKVMLRTAELLEREQEHLQLLESSPFPIAVARLSDAAMLYGNPALLALLGVDPERLTSHPAGDFYAAKEERDLLMEVVRQQGRAEAELRLRTIDGREIDVMAAMRGTRFAGEPAVITSMVDISARKAAAAALRDSQERYRQLFEAESDALLLIENETGRILEANAAASRLYGYTSDELRAMCNHELLADPETTQHTSRSTPVDFETVVRIPLRHHRRHDGSAIPVEITARFFELGGRGVHIAAIRDISAHLATESALRDANSRLSQHLAEIEALQSTLQEQALRDPLTRLYNRRFLEEACARELARAQREGYPVALAIFDLDRFKRINDTYGHAAGDEVLIAVAELLQQKARVSDVACRYGGEEFVLLLPRIALAEARVRVEELRQACAERTVVFGSFGLSVTLSAGIAAYPAHGLTAREIIARADDALYRAKNAGRNRVEAWDEVPLGA